MEEDPQAPRAGPGNPGHGGVLAGAERGERQDQDHRDGRGGGPVHEHPLPVPGQQHGDRVRRHDQQGQLVQVAACDQQHGVGQPASRGEAGPAGFLIRRAGLGGQGVQQRQRGAGNAGEDQGVRPGGLRVVADRRGQRDDQPGEQAGPARPGQPPADDDGQGHGHDHGDHRGDPHHRRAGACRHPAVHQQVVQPVHRVNVAEQVGQQMQREQRGPPGGHLVVAHGRVPRQPPHPEHGHDRGGQDGRPVPGHRPLPGRSRGGCAGRLGPRWRPAWPGRRDRAAALPGGTHVPAAGWSPDPANVCRHCSGPVNPGAADRYSAASLAHWRRSRRCRIRLRSPSERNSFGSR